MVVLGKWMTGAPWGYLTLSSSGLGAHWPPLPPGSNSVGSLWGTVEGPRQGQGLPTARAKSKTPATGNTALCPLNARSVRETSSLAFRFSHSSTTQTNDQSNPGWLRKYLPLTDVLYIHRSNSMTRQPELPAGNTTSHRVGCASILLI